MSSKKEQAERYARYERAVDNAHAAASKAQQGMQDNRNALDCGFAWVTVRDPGFMTWLRRQAKSGSNRYGRKWASGGWTFWCPGDFNGQSIGVHEAGAKAFRDSLAHELQIYVETSSRLD